MQMKIVITGQFPDTAKENIIRSFPTAWEISIVPPTLAERELPDADVLIPEHIQINAALLKKAPHLKLVQTGAGYDNVDVEACTECGVQVCNAAGVNATAVAEHVMAFLLCWYKNIIYLDNFIKTHQNESQMVYTGAELSEKTIGIVGLGHVGKKVAEYCQSFHMNVLGYSYKPIEIDGVEIKDLDELYQVCDIISLHVPLNETTRHMINADAFAKMKSDALLVNTSRGAIIDEAQLIQALQYGTIGGACLDVYEDEPLAQDNPLRDLNRVILTPHTAGLPDGLKYHKKRYAFFVQNIEKVLRNELPECRINELSK